jgi:osmoprotectant transport system ATP-binding protein
VISVENAVKSFGQFIAVNDVSFEVKEGENLVLLGSSGSGKTTTLRMINRLIIPDQGRIRINDKDISGVPEEILRRNIGYVLQHNALFPHYTVAENIAIVPALQKWEKQQINARTAQLLEKLHLPAEQFLNAMPHELSGGQQQRVNVARALAANPDILLMDEPFGALDPITRSTIVKDFKQLDELKKKTIVMVTHDVAEAFEIGDRICIMDQGRIMQIGTPSELLFQPSNQYVKAFLEKQHLNLAMKTVRIKDIARWLPGNGASGEPVDGVSPESTIWDVLESGEKQNDEASDDVPVGRVHKKSTLSEILMAYSQYKNSIPSVLFNKS